MFEIAKENLGKYQGAEALFWATKERFSYFKKMKICDAIIFLFKIFSEFWLRRIKIIST